MKIDKVAGRKEPMWKRRLQNKIKELRKDLKVVSATFVLVFFLSLNESTCQTMKSVFYFTSKALFILEKIIF